MEHLSEDQKQIILHAYASALNEEGEFKPD
jgi:hypothetical protein